MGDAHATPCEPDAICDGEDAGDQGEEDEGQLERRHDEWVLHDSDNPSDMTSSSPASCSPDCAYRSQASHSLRSRGRLAPAPIWLS